MKQNDWLIANINNPTFTSLDFKNILDLNLDNTLFLSKDEYLKNNFIRENDRFKNSEGVFSENKFNEYYDNVSKSFLEFSTESNIDNYQYSIWDVNRPKEGKIKKVNVGLNRINNPDDITMGISGINKIENSNKSKRELALNSKIYDPETNTFLDKTVNDISLFSNPIEYFKSLYDEPLVYATYDEDTVEKDPVTGREVTHKKGEWKLDPEGNYYTERLNGRSLLGKTVVSSADYLTSENSSINKYDFMDADDLEKSIAGVVAKNVVAALPMFIPYANIGSIYSGLLVARELSKTTPMLYGMILSIKGEDNIDNKLANTIAAYGQKFSGGTSDYAQENTFSFENFGNLLSEVALQWGLLLLIADSFRRITLAGDNILQTAYIKAEQLYRQKSLLAITDLFEKKISIPLFTSYVGAADMGGVKSLLESGKWMETTLGRNAIEKFVPKAKEIFAKRNKLGGDLSLVYMSLISNTDVYDTILLKGGTPEEAALIAAGSMIGMFSVDKYLGLGEMFLALDGSRKAIKESAVHNAALYMEGKNVAADTNTKKGIIGTLLKGIESGKKAVDEYFEKVKDGSLSIAGKSIGEGLEEVSEELVSDLSKTLGELAGKLGYFSLEDYGAWEQAGDRYLMSFLGGAAGGALYGIKANWNGLQTLEFLNEITYLLRQGKKQEIFKELEKLKKKGSLGDTNLSYNQDSNGTYLTANENRKSQADVNYESLTNIINQLDLILNDNNLNLSEDDLFDKMVQGEYRATILSDFLKGDNLETVKELSYISKFQEDFLRLTDEITNKELEIKNHISSVIDSEKSNNETYKNKLNKLLQEKQSLLDEKEYLFGEGSLGYVEKTLFAMDSKLSGRFGTLNYNQFVRELLGKSASELTEAENEYAKKQFDLYSKQTKYTLDLAFKIFKLMGKEINPSILELLNLNPSQELSKIKELRDSDPFNNWISPENKLENETDEEYQSFFNKREGETDELFNLRKQDRIAKIQKYNEDNIYNWILEFLNKPITSTDFRYLSNRIPFLKKLLLNGALLNLTGENLNLINDLKGIILSIGIDNKESLDKAIYNRMSKEAESVVKDLYGETLDRNTEWIANLIGKSNSEPILLKDIYTFIQNYINDGKSLDDALEDLNDDLGNLENEELNNLIINFYNNSLNNPENLNSEDANIIIATNDEYYNSEKDKITEEYVSNIMESLDKIIKPLLQNNIYKTLSKLQSTTFTNNPVIPILSLISKKSANINVESFLQEIYTLYSKGDTSTDFLLSDLQLQILNLVLQDLDIALSFVYAASTEANTINPVGHNKTLNLFVHNHKNVFTNYEDLPEIDKNIADFLIGEFKAYLKEIESWIDKHNKNTSLQEKRFFQAEAALTKGTLDFFKINRDKFKISELIDLLEGYENLTITESLSSLVSIQELVYRNYNKAIASGLTLNDILDNILPKISNIDNIILLDTARLDENFKYGNFTDYDKFLLLISSMSASTIKYYEGLKLFLAENPTMAPISILEYVSKIAYALNLNPEFINSALEYIKAKSNSKLGIVWNGSIVTGLGGSGKTFAVARLNMGTGKNTLVSGPDLELINGLLTSLPDSKGISKEELLNMVFGGKIPSAETLYDIVDNNGFKTIALKNNVLFLLLTNTPENIVIDESTHFSSLEILAISEFCKYNNIKLTFIGDGHLNGFQDGNLFNILPNVLLAWRTPDLYLSLRNSNVHKYFNLKQIIDPIDVLSSTPDASFAEVSKKVYENIFTKLEFKYYNKEVFLGELLTNKLTDDIINNIPKNASIGFIGNLDSPSYKFLKEKGYNPEVKSPLLVLGKEYQYTIVDIPWSFTKDTDWYNTGVNMIDFLKNLYTIISRSKEGSIILDNNLSKYVKNIEAEFAGISSTIEKSVENFRKHRLPLIEEALQNNKYIEPELKPTKPIVKTEVTLDGNKISEQDLLSEEKPEEKADNTEELQQSNEQELTSESNIGLPIRVYSNISHSGIDTTKEIWTNEEDSKSDLGIFIRPGMTIEKGKKKLYITYVKNLKDVIIYGTDLRERLDLNIRKLFSEESFKEARYFVVVEDESNYNRLIGFTEGTGLKNSKRTIGNNKIVKLVARLKGSDGNVYSVTLGGLNNPETWEQNKKNIKNAIQERINLGDSLLEEYKNKLDSIITNYKNKIDSITLNNLEFEINKPIFNLDTLLYNLDNSYRFVNINNDSSPYESKSPIQVMSPIYGVLDDLEGISPKIKGHHPVRFVSDCSLLYPSELKDIYLEQLKNPNLPKRVRMMIVDTKGISFKSLYQVQYKDLYNIKVGPINYLIPAEASILGMRMYLAMWNFRAGLNRFNNAYIEWRNNNNYTDDIVEKLCLLDNKLFNQLRNGKEKYSEALYRQDLENNSEILESNKLKVKSIWDFNDSLAPLCKEFRLGYSTEHGAYIRTLTNLDGTFYENKSNVKGVYLNPSIAREYTNAVNVLFTNIIDKLVPSPSENINLYITQKLSSIENWVNTLKKEGNISLQVENSDEKIDILITDKSLLSALPFKLKYAALYMNKVVNMGRDYYLLEILDNEHFKAFTLKYNIDDNKEEELNWFEILDLFKDLVSLEESNNFEYIKPGIIPYKTEKDENGNIISKIGYKDSRIDDMFNLMFHGLISTKVPNDFSRDDIRADYAYFKYGIFLDPIVQRRTNNENNAFDLIAIDERFYGSDAATGGSVIMIDLDNPVNTTNEPTEIIDTNAIELETTELPKIEFELSKVEKIHNLINDLLGASGIDLSYMKSLPSIEDYIDIVSSQIKEINKLYTTNNKGISLDKLITGILYDEKTNKVTIKYFIEENDLSGKSIEIRNRQTNSMVLLIENTPYVLLYDIMLEKLTLTKIVEPTKPETEPQSKVKTYTYDSIASAINNIIDSIILDSDINNEIKEIFSYKSITKFIPKNNILAKETKNKLVNNFIEEVNKNFNDIDNYEELVDNLKPLLNEDCIIKSK